MNPQNLSYANLDPSSHMAESVEGLQWRLLGSERHPAAARPWGIR
jgi:hypothetical protein